ncbi:MAG: aldehyde reductase [Cyclobacteriaceae bacterium]|nr:aldehyde reductase [Cyclobacteriaceae bacterium]
MEKSKVLVTGATGYIGGWVVKYLLEEGYTVHITVRDKSKKKKYEHLLKLADQSKGTLQVFEADLLDGNSFIEPMKDCEVVFHIASPFIINNIKDPQTQLIDPALEGTRNVLNAVNTTESVKRVVLTSSTVAICGDNADMKDQGLKAFTEQHWNTTSNLKHQPYAFSKVLAEKEAQKIADAQSRWSLSVINPGFVMGPSLAGSTSSGSFEFIRDYLSGKLLTGVPMLVFSYVDVRDVARAHILAAEKNSDGRHIITNKSFSMLEVSKILKGSAKKKGLLPKFQAPKFMLYIIGPLFGLSSKFVSRNIGYSIQFDNSKSKEKLGLEYRSIETALKEMVEQMEK